MEDESDVTSGPLPIHPVENPAGGKVIVLVGLMGAGKSTVGRRLAARLGVNFLDADSEIESAAGMTIHEIFEKHGEPAFRRGEIKVIKRILQDMSTGSPPGGVLATGGGAYMNADIRDAIAQFGVSVWLRADIDLLVRRVGRRNNRPLLKQGDARETLLRLRDERYPVYALADIVVDSADAPHEEVVDMILARLAEFFGGSAAATEVPPHGQIVPVALAERAYDIHVGAGLLSQAGDLIAPLLRRNRVAIVTDENVAGHHLARLTGVLQQADVAPVHLIIKPGESSKNFNQLELVLDWMIEQKIERGDLLLAFGGGVIGDLTGFAAAILRRGVDFAQIPTTLLAQVDSSVGGKTGINSRFGKNLIGAFHQPRLVIADVTLLDSLPVRELLAGYAEIVKYALIGDAAFMDWLEQSGAGVRDGDQSARIHAVRTSCMAKAALVVKDERESGPRALLNLGHTFGHALEAETGYSARLLHGEGVAIGMCLAFELAVRLGLAPAQDAMRVAWHLSVMGLPTTIRDIAGASLNPDHLLAHMAQDKKVADGRINFILPRKIGDCFITSEIDPEMVLQVLRASAE